MRHRDQSAESEFNRVDSSQEGYSVKMVNAYFEQLAFDYRQLRSGVFDDVISSSSIRKVSFPPEKGGYLPHEVDLALDKVEDRFAILEREDRRRRTGVLGLPPETKKLADAVMNRLSRPAGERFRRPSQNLVKGYYQRDVDLLCDKLRKHLGHSEVLDPRIVRSARFRSATGDMCYEETQVDAFLDRCIELILDLR